MKNNLIETLGHEAAGAAAAFHVALQGFPALRSALDSVQGAMDLAGLGHKELADTARYATAAVVGAPLVFRAF